MGRALFQQLTFSVLGGGAAPLAGAQREVPDLPTDLRCPRSRRVGHLRLRCGCGEFARALGRTHKPAPQAIDATRAWTLRQNNHDSTLRGADRHFERMVSCADARRPSIGAEARLNTKRFVSRKCIFGGSEKGGLARGPKKGVRWPRPAPRPGPGVWVPTARATN